MSHMNGYLLISVVLTCFRFCITSIHEDCPTEQEIAEQDALSRRRHPDDSLEFLFELKNASGCLGRAAKLNIFYIGNNHTVFAWYKILTSANRSVHDRRQPIQIDRRKFFMLSAESKYEDDYYLFICNLTSEDAGHYVVELSNNIGTVSQSVFISVSNCGNVTEAVSTTPADHLHTRVYVLCVLLPVVVVVCLTSVVIVCLKKRRRKTRKQRRSQTNVVHDNPIYSQIPSPDVAPVVLPAFDPKWEIGRESLLLDHLLGEGAFGKVYRGTYFSRGSSLVVAVKMLKDNCSYRDRLDFIKEIEMMKTIGHHRNIIGFHGYSISDGGDMQVVVEFAKFGNLRDFLREAKSLETERTHLTPALDSDEMSPKRLTFSDLVSFSFQVARGMEYLSLQMVIHRDLAARNVLVGDNLVLKIADFGLTRNTQVRNYYQRLSSGLLPVMWMAPESLSDNRYTTKSDVWAFGVLLWEIFSFGEDPYKTVPSEELLDRLLHGYRMEIPALCSPEVSEVIRNCWDLNPCNRPEFRQLVESFDRLVTSSSSFDYLSLEILTDDGNDEVFCPNSLESLPRRSESDAESGLSLELRELPHSSSDSQYASISSRPSASSFTDAGTLSSGCNLESDNAVVESISSIL